MKSLATCVIAMTLLAGVARAEDKPAAEKGPEKKVTPRPPAIGHIQRVITLNNPDLAGGLADVLGAFPALTTRWNKDLGVIVVSGPPSEVEAALDIARRLDVAPDKKQAARLRSMDFTAQLLIARPEPVKGPLPAELAPVVEQLKGLFQYGGYELLDTLVLRSSERGSGGGESWLEGAVSSKASGTTKSYEYRFTLNNPMVAGEDEKGRTIRIGRLFLSLQVRSGGGLSADQNEPPKAQKIHISTGLDMREGQKVVVGKAALDGNEALILVLSVKTLS
jgi:hypothetical protein